MTNEEAKEIIIKERDSLKANPIVKVEDCLYEAFDLAIKALEQQQRDCNTCKHSDNGNCAYTEECHECMWKSKYEQQLCEDCISREAVDEYITNLLSGYLYDEERTRLEDLTAYIWELPSVIPQPCEEAISRQAVMNIISFEYGWLIDAKEYNTNIRIAFNSLMSKVKALPSVTPKAEQKWIPVSERLPESDEEYHTFLVTDSKGKVTLSEFYLSLDRKPYWSGMIDVIAWMPLPQSYKAESEDKE